MIPRVISNPAAVTVFIDCLLNQKKFGGQMYKEEMQMEILAKHLI
jgi:hypothetical protein